MRRGPVEAILERRADRVDRAAVAHSNIIDSVIRYRAVRSDGIDGSKKVYLLVCAEFALRRTLVLLKAMSAMVSVLPL